MAKRRWELWVLTAVAIFCGVVSLFIPPQGVIDPSVLQFIALLLGFGVVISIPDAIRAGVAIKATTKAGTLEVSKKDRNKPCDCKDNDNDNNDTK